MHDPLKLRGAKVMLEHAIVYIGRGQAVYEYSGRYCDVDIEVADKLLRTCIWHVDCDLRKENR